MSSHEGSTSHNDCEHIPDPQRGQQVLDLLQDIENPQNLKELKTMMGNRSLNEVLALLKDIHQVYQNMTNEIAVLEAQQQGSQAMNETTHDEYHTLQTKYLDLKKHLTNPLPGQQQDGDTLEVIKVKVDGEEDEYELDKIIACRLYQKKQLQYKVSWVGYDPDDTWYPAGDFKNSPHALRMYHEEHPDGPPPPKRLEVWACCYEADKTDPDHPDDDKPAEIRHQ